MEKEGFFLLAKVYKTQGLKGRVLIYMMVDNPQDYLNEQVMHLELDGNLVPFFVLEISHKKAKQYSVLFQDIHTVEDAQKITGKEIYLSNASRVNSKYDINVIGYQVFDQNEKALGEVIEVIQNPAHPIVKLMINENEVMLPLPEDFIIALNHEQKQVHVHVPPGLIDLYVN